MLIANDIIRRNNAIQELGKLNYLLHSDESKNNYKITQLAKRSLNLVKETFHFMIDVIKWPYFGSTEMMNKLVYSPHRLSYLFFTWINELTPAKIDEKIKNREITETRDPQFVQLVHDAKTNTIMESEYQKMQNS